MYFGILENLKQKLNEVFVVAKTEHVEDVTLAAARELHVTDNLVIRGLQIDADRVALLQKLKAQTEVSVGFVKIVHDVVLLQLSHSKKAIFKYISDPTSSR